MLFKEKKFLQSIDKGILFLNITQFSVVLVDNIFKLIIAFFLIDISGKHSASQILSLVGAVYVIPFLLLSSIGGSLADRFSKRTITIFIKCMGGCILLAALYIFHIKSAFGCYTLLFLLSTQSAIFGPSKYGMIPELVPAHKISTANGYITSFTYLAIIFGTFLGSFLSQAFHKNYMHVLYVTLVFSMIGIIASFLIPKVSVPKFKASFNFAVFGETIKIIKSYSKKSHLVISIFAAAFFLMTGAFIQLGMIPFTIEVLHLDEFIGGYLFLTTALGIALGSQFVGKLTKGMPNLLFPTLGGIVLAVMLLSLGIFAKTAFTSIIFLVILGIAGGFYIVPIDAFIQMTATSEQRGRIIGANNFLGFTGVLIASFFLYFFIEVLHLEPNEAIFFMGLLTTAFSLYFSLSVSDRLVASIISSSIFNKKKMVYLPNDVEVLIVDEPFSHVLKKIRIKKEAVYFYKSSKSFLKASCFLLPEDKLSIKERLEKESHPSRLIILQKKDIDFDLPSLCCKFALLEHSVK